MQLVKTKQTFNDDLEYYINNIPEHNLLIVAGNFNARVGYDSHNNTIQKLLENIFFIQKQMIMETNLCRSVNLPILE
jgi:hypothetical protein